MPDLSDTVCTLAWQSAGTTQRSWLHDIDNYYIPAYIYILDARAPAARTVRGYDGRTIHAPCLTIGASVRDTQFAVYSIFQRIFYLQQGRNALSTYEYIRVHAVHVLSTM